MIGKTQCLTMRGFAYLSNPGNRTIPMAIQTHPMQEVTPPNPQGGCL